MLFCGDNICNVANGLFLFIFSGFVIDVIDVIGVIGGFAFERIHAFGRVTAFPARSGAVLH
jgi:hypothetical protein